MIIESKIKNYKLQMEPNVLSRLSDFLAENQVKKPFFLIDKKVYELYSSELNACIKDAFFELVDATEGNKEYIKLANYFRCLIEAKMTRDDTLVTIGGGVLQDISGFIASTLYRGLKWIFIPTTLLAQADSCIGSKTSINFGTAKNLIGTFCPPDVIYNDITFCQTLPQHEFNSGVGEIIKFHLLSDEGRFSELCDVLAEGNLRENPKLEHVIFNTLMIKKSYFDEDEFDKGRRNLLNYGHCFGHALESAANFSITHGEAVLVGMGIADVLSVSRGYLSETESERQYRVMSKFYPEFNWSKIKINNVIAYMKLDKKRVSNQLTMILSHGIGLADKHNDVTEAEVITSFNKFLATYPVKEKINA